MPVWSEVMNGAWSGSLLAFRKSHRDEAETGTSPLPIVVHDWFQLNCAMALYCQFALASKTIVPLNRWVKGAIYLIPVAMRYAIHGIDTQHEQGKIASKGKGYEWLEVFDRGVGKTCQVVGLASSLGLAFYGQKTTGLTSAAFIVHGYLFRRGYLMGSMPFVGTAGFIATQLGRGLSGLRASQVLAVAEIVAHIVNRYLAFSPVEQLWEINEGQDVKILDKKVLNLSASDFRVSHKHMVGSTMNPSADPASVDGDLLMQRLRDLFPQDEQECAFLNDMNTAILYGKVGGNHDTYAKKVDLLERGLRNLVYRVKNNWVYKVAKHAHRNSNTCPYVAWVLNQVAAEPSPDQYARSLINLGLNGHLCGEGIEETATVIAQERYVDTSEKHLTNMEKLRLQVNRVLEMPRYLYFRTLIHRVFEDDPRIEYFIKPNDPHVDRKFRRLLGGALGLKTLPSRKQYSVSLIESATQAALSYLIRPYLADFFNQEYTVEKVTQYVKEGLRAGTISMDFVNEWFGKIELNNDIIWLTEGDKGYLPGAKVYSDDGILSDNGIRLFLNNFSDGKILELATARPESHA